MPVVIAGLVRYAIQVIVLYGVTEGGVWILNTAIKSLMKLFGATEEQANAVVANAVLQTIEYLGISVATLKVKLPTNVALKLGFTSNGFKPQKSILGERPIKPVVGAPAPIPAGQVAAVLEEASSAIAIAKGFKKTTIVLAMGLVFSGISSLTSMGLLMVNTIDFGAWSSSAYQKTFQWILGIFGLEPDKDYVKSKVLSGDMFTKIYATYELTGAVNITDPRTGTKLPFSRENLVAVADFLGAQIVLEKGEIKTKELIAVLTAFVVFDEKKAGTGATATATGGQPAGTVSGPRVFTGLLSQGKLGSGLTFVPREDDIIDSIDDLQSAAENNLASYLASLPGRVIYELKVVPSVTTKDGFRQVGAQQKIVSKIKEDGTPQYRTLTNKFATLTLYLLTDKETKSKIATITLGPTDAVKFQPKVADLVELEKKIQKTVVTSDLNAITGVGNGGAVETPGAITQTDPAFIPAPAGVMATWDPLTINATGGRSLPGGGLEQSFVYNRKGYTVLIPPNYPKPFIEAMREELEKQGVISPAGGASGAPVRPGAQATNLREWYEANGQQLPSAEARSLIYQKYGLGQSSLYTGTTEQNEKLLTYLKTGAL